jgi:hypothetical protein
MEIRRENFGGLIEGPAIFWSPIATLSDDFESLPEEITARAVL